MSEHLEINLHDTNRRNFDDSMNSNKSRVIQPSSFQGLVEIKDKNTGEILTKSSNLIVYRGRAMALCRMFGKDLSWQSVTPTQVPFGGMKDKYVAFFAVGTGGSATGNSQSPLSVNATDYQMNTHGDISGTSSFVTINSRTYRPFDSGYPEYISESEITNNTSIYNTLQNVNYNSVKRDAYLISKLQVTLESGDANGSGGTQEISEAGIFLAESNDVNYDFSSYTTNNQHLDMFAKINFATITKNSSRSLTFSWYIYF